MELYEKIEVSPSEPKIMGEIYITRLGKEYHMKQVDIRDSEVERAALDYSYECLPENHRAARVGFIACWKWFKRIQ